MDISLNRAISGVVIFLAIVVFSFGLPGACADEPNAEWPEVVGPGEEFPIGDLRPQKGWVDDPVPADEWQPVDQPDLADRLAAAPQLELTTIAQGPKTIGGGYPHLAPNPEGSWDLIMNFQRHYRRLGEVFIFDLGEGELVRRFPIARYRGDTLMERHRFEYRTPAYYIEDSGKVVFEHYGPIFFTVYDPAEKDFVHATLPFEGHVRQGRAVLSEDGRLFGVGFTFQRLRADDNPIDPGNDGGRLFVYEVDTETFEVSKLAIIGPPNRHRQETYRGVVMSGDWIYGALGNRPWHMIAYNVQTGEGHVVATTEDVRGSHQSVNMTPVEGGLMGSVQQPVEVRGIDLDEVELVPFRDRPDGPPTFNFWIDDQGKVYPRDGNIPPWSEEPAQRLTYQARWRTGPGPWSDYEHPTPAPELRRQGPDIAGRTTLEYRFDEDEDWRSIDFTTEMHPVGLGRMMELNENIIFGTSTLAGHQLFYDLENERVRRIRGHSVYSMGFSSDNFYTAGYSLSQMREYDLERPLDRDADEPNPRHVGYIGRASGETHYPLDRVVELSDGRIYKGGTTVGRRRVGGGWGWYDPETGDIGGTPLDNQRIFWLDSASDGRYLLMSSKGAGEPSNLYCWDAEKQEMMYEKPIFDDGRNPGPIVEAMPGLIIGHSPTGDDQGVLFGLKAETGEVLWTKEVPARPVTSWGACRRHNYTFRRGPDGFVWAFFGNTLVRIDPRNAYVEPVGRTSPRQMAFAGGRVFITGGHGLRVIEGIETPVW